MICTWINGYHIRIQPNISSKEALHFLLEWIRREPGNKLITKTRLFIVPGYQFKIVKGLITNFHQPSFHIINARGRIYRIGMEKRIQVGVRK